jgi:uncharacterized protein (DUF1697 family)
MTLAVALLRGVNVGGRAMLSMPELRAALTRRGFEQVQTYVQSGNVILDPGKGGVRQLAVSLEQAISENFELTVRVLVRTRKELGEVAAGHPLGMGQSEHSRLHVIFLETTPADDKVAALDPDRSPPDHFEVRGREIFLSYPNGQGRSKLDLAYFERVLGVAGTARNWNTVTKLLSMLA